jgi:hypothetical protein
MALFELHLLRRAVESLAVMVYPPEAKMHLIAYVFGLRYAPTRFLLSVAGFSLFTSAHACVVGLKYTVCTQ